MHRTIRPDSSRRRSHWPAAPRCAALAWPALASSRRVVAAMTDGPFYPPRAWREQWTDWDADLSRVQRDGRTLVGARRASGPGTAAGRHATAAPIDGAEVEIWQCDVLAAYRHPGVRLAAGQYDEAFQGFGASRSDRDGRLRFRTIKPVPYPGRTPHIHVKLRHASFGEVTSQLFIAGDPGNARDFLWRAVDAADRPMLEMQAAAGRRRQRPALAGAAALVLPA